MSTKKITYTKDNQVADTAANYKLVEQFPRVSEGQGALHADDRAYADFRVGKTVSGKDIIVRKHYPSWGRKGSLERIQ